MDWGGGGDTPVHNSVGIKVVMRDTDNWANVVVQQEIILDENSACDQTNVDRFVDVQQDFLWPRPLFMTRQIIVS
jgi:hypothetical protein